VYLIGWLMHKEKVNILLEKIKDGDEAAFENLAEVYRPLLLSVASSFDATAKNEGINDIFADLNQELTLALYRAARTFDTDQDKVTFGNYAKRCLKNCAISFLRKSRSAKRREQKVKTTLKKEQKVFTPPFPQDTDGNGKSALESAKAILSPYEFKIFSKYIDGERVSDISHEVGKSAKSVSNAIFRCKAKVKRIYKDR